MSKTAVASAVASMLRIRAMHCQDVVIGIVTQNPITGQVSNITFGQTNASAPQDFLKTMEVEPVKIEPPVATVAPTQTAVNPPARRGRPKGSKNKVEATAPVAVETPVETTTPKRGRGRPKGSGNKTAAESTPAAATTTTSKKGKRQQGMATDIFNLAEDFIGTLVHVNPDKDSRTPVYIVSESPKGCKVASPQKDQSGVAIGYVKCAVWFSVLAKQERRSDSLNIAALFN